MAVSGGPWRPLAVLHLRKPPQELEVVVSREIRDEGIPQPALRLDEQLRKGEVERLHGEDVSEKEVEFAGSSSGPFEEERSLAVLGGPCRSLAVPGGP